MEDKIKFAGIFRRELQQGEKFEVIETEPPVREGALGVEQIVILEKLNRDKNLNHRYDLAIRQFFEGQDHHIRMFEFSREDGHIWICGHGLFDTLTVEPPEGGQYEIAIRIRSKTKEGKQVPGIVGCQDKEFAGYKITGDGWLVGWNTDGH